MDMLDTHPSTRTRRWRALGATVAAALVAVPVLSVATAAALTPLTITLTVTSRAYDGTTDAVITGCAIVEDTTGTDLGCDITGADAEFSTADAGTGVALTNITGVILTGNDAVNYEINSVSGSADINTVELTATSVTVADKDYDGTDDATVTGCTLTGVIGSESVDCSGTGTFDSADAGTGVNVALDTLELTGTTAANYTLATPWPSASADIDALVLTVTPADLSVTYGDAAPDAAFYPYSISGFITGEDETNADGYTAPTCGSAYADGDAVGTTAITCTGGSATNYTVDVTASGTLTIDPATITVTPDTPSTITYGDGTPTPLSFVVTGFVNGESDSDEGYTAPTCTVTYASGDAAGDYTVDCSGGSYANYDFSYDTATLVVAPFELTPVDVWYTGQTEAYTASASETAARVTLTASITADLDGAEGSEGCVDGGASVSDGTVTFTDQLSGRVIAKNVAISEVAGNCEEGIATAFGTLSTGQNGTEMYAIVVTVDGSFSGSNADAGGQLDTDFPSSRVVVSLPVTPGTVQGYGSLDVTAGTGTFELGTEGSLTGEMDGEAASTVFRFVPGTRKVTPKGQAVVMIPAGEGYYYVKSNSITSVTVNGSVTTVFAKASITLVGGSCPTETCAIDGNVSLRLDVYDEATDRVGFTIQSSKGSALYYSNDWYKEGRAWKTRGQVLSLS
jgi:hypothetical protein